MKVAAVSYLNTRPLLYGIDNSVIRQQIELDLNYPSLLAEKLKSGAIDLALLPVAAIPSIPGAHIISDYGIATDGNVVSVALFSQVPLNEVKSVYLDYQSRTSVRLAQILFEKHWKKEVTYLQATEHYIDYINGPKAGVIIGDRALQQINNFDYVYDLSAAWKAFSGLDFVFAAWVANKDLPASFIEAFNAANALGVQHIDDVLKQVSFPWYDLDTYYKKNICYYIDANKKAGLNRFLQML